MLRETVRVALRSIRANALRSILTCLGIIIGIAAVIAMVALGRGARESVQAQLEAMGTNVLFVRAGFGRMGGVSQGEKPLTVGDADALRRDGRGFLVVVPQMSRNAQVEYLGENVPSSVNGTTPEYQDAEGARVEVGRFLTEGDLEGRRRVAVVGPEVARNLKVAPAELLGQTIKIRGVNFEVVGTLESKGATSWFNPDDQVFVPLTTAQFRLFGGDQLRSITVKAESTEAVPLAITEIERIMRRQHRLREGQDNDFSIRDQTELRATVESTGRTFAFLLAGIAAISLVVGGIGIMNIMMVAVTERTREIGVRKAVGATSHAILLQFLTEAMVLCVLGGLLGIGLGVSAASLMTRMAGWSAIVTVESIVLAVATSAAVGLFFGVYPALRASRLDPIEALRYE